MKIHIYCNTFYWELTVYMDEKCQHFIINMYCHNVELIWEHRFLYNICSPLHSPQLKDNFDFHMYSKYGGVFFRARQAKIEIWRMSFFWRERASDWNCHIPSYRYHTIYRLLLTLKKMNTKETLKSEGVHYVDLPMKTAILHQFKYFYKNF